MKIPRLLRFTTFRQRFFASYFILLVCFLLFIFPLVSKSVRHIVFSSMNNRAKHLIRSLQKAKDDLELIQIVKKHKHLVFYRIGVLDNTLRLLYDTHTRHLSGSLFFPLQFSSHSEIQDAVRDGIGYAEVHSHILNQKMIYLAKRFDFQSKPYYLRLAFPYEYTQNLRRKFELGFILFSSVVLVLFSMLSSLVIHRLMQPIRQIIKAIQPYQMQKSTSIAYIDLKRSSNDEFQRLADTLNSLSTNIQKHIASLTHERNEKEAILESLTEGVLAVDQSMKISYANNLALKLLGLTRSSIGTFFPQVSHPRYFELLSSKKVTNDTLQVTIDNQKLHLNIVTSPRQNNTGSILVLQDVSIHYKVLQMRKDFIANASHELKTPLTIIQGFAETLKDNPDLSQEIVQPITNKIVTNCERMSKTVRNLLTLADIEHLPQSRVSTCNLIELATDCKNRIEELYPSAQITLEYDAHIDIQADRELLEIALTNLMDNAAKYTHDAPKISVFLEKKEGYVEIKIKDNGIGIPETDIEHIFQRFYRVNKAQSKKLGGSGLGLSIVETIVEKHFGTISVESEYGKGSTFTIKIKNASINQ